MNRRLHLPAWQRLALYGTAAVLLLSGAAWLVLHWAFGAGTGELPHIAEAPLMRLHGAAGFAALFMLGVLAAGHIPQGWRLSGHRHGAGQRRTGVALCSLAALLVVTAYTLYYFAPEQLRPVLGWGHSAVGLVMAGVAFVHARRT